MFELTVFHLVVILFSKIVLETAVDDIKTQTTSFCFICRLEMFLRNGTIEITKNRLCQIDRGRGTQDSRFSP